MKSAMLFKMHSPEVVKAALSEQVLEENKFIPLHKTQLKCNGFVPLPYSDGSMMYHASGMSFVCMQTAQKIIPAKVVDKHIYERVTMIENKEKRKVFKKERSMIKDDVMLELLPRAFVKDSFTTAFFDWKKGFFIVEARTDRAGEEVCNLIRAALGEFAISRASTKDAFSKVATHRLKTKQSFLGIVTQASSAYGERLKLIGKEDETYVFRKEDNIINDAIHNHLEAGMMAIEMELLMPSLLLSVNDQLVLTGIKLTDSALQSISERELDSEKEVEQANLLMQSAAISQFYVNAIEELGGLAT